jgi:hypothetical protein
MPYSPSIDSGGSSRRTAREESQLRITIEW